MDDKDKPDDDAIDFSLADEGDDDSADAPRPKPEMDHDGSDVALEVDDLGMSMNPDIDGEDSQEDAGEAVSETPKSFDDIAEPAVPPEDDVLDLNVSGDPKSSQAEPSLSERDKPPDMGQAPKEPKEPPPQDRAKKYPPISSETSKNALVRPAALATSGDNSGGAGNNGNRLGDRLVSLGVITDDQLKVALQEKRISGRMIGEVMVDLGFVAEETIIAVLAESSGFQVFDPTATIVDGDALALIEKSVAQQHKILPVSVKGDEINVAMADPYDVLAMDTLKSHLPRGMKIKPMVTTASVFSQAIDAAYGYASKIDDILHELEAINDEKTLSAIDGNEAFTHPIVRLVNALVFGAVKIGASDLHFEPEENFVRLRYRVDGVLFTAQVLHKKYWNGVSQRLKIMAEMNIADKINAQDGRFNLNIGGREADFRVSSLPTINGENIVLRVLDKSESIMPLEGLGFSEENRRKIESSQKKPEGIVIVTGPTGSGKTTTLYSMLNEINDVEVNIQTLEDPVEYALPMIRQTHVREGVLDFADGIKALLRQDPDIIFVGEVRDHTTAEMALKAAMTGHQVYTSLHTNDSFGAVPRLLDLGLKPGMLAGAIVAVFAQRLARRLCNSCKVPYTPDIEESELLGVDPDSPPEIYKAREGGCPSCGGHGYKGRIAMVEILTFDDDLDEVLARGGSKAEMKKVALKKGFKSMRDDGILKILDGITDIEAVAKVIDLRH